MSSKFRNILVGVMFLIGILLGVAALKSEASEYPQRPIRVVLGMPASSTFPIITKAITENVQDKRFTFFNDHKVGQGNLIAYKFAADSKADGYTIFFASTSLVVNPLLHKDAGFDPVTDFEVLLFLGKVDNALLVHPSVPFRSVSDMVKYARKNPEKLMYGHNGFATQSFLAIELLTLMTKTKFTSIPYANRGTDTAIIDLFSGEIDIHLPVIGRAPGYVNTGKAKILASTGAQRSALFPQTPTVAESIPGFESSIWYALMAPKGMPEKVKQDLIEQLTIGAAHPTARRILENTGVNKFSVTAGRENAFVMAEQVKWGKLIKEKQIKAE